MKILGYFLILISFSSITRSAEWEHFVTAAYTNDYIIRGDYIYQAHTNGFSVYNMATENRTLFTPVNSILPGSYINSLLELDDGRILVSTNGGLMIINKDASFSVEEPICKNYPLDDARDLSIDSNGTIWTFSDTEVLYYKDNNWISFDLKNYIPDTVVTRFEIYSMYILNGQVWISYNDTRKSETRYYFSSALNLYLRYVVMNEDGIIKVFTGLPEDNPDYPFRQGEANLAAAGNKILLQRSDTLFVYDGNKWDKVSYFDFGDFKNNFYTRIQQSSDGKIWGVVSNGSRYSPAFYDPSTNKSERLELNPSKNIAFFSILKNGLPVFYNTSDFYHFVDGKWEEIPFSNLHIKPGTYISNVRNFNDNLWTLTNTPSDVLPAGSIVKLFNNYNVPPYSKGTKYRSFTNLALKLPIDRNYIRGAFKGKWWDEYFCYTADSGLVRMNTVANSGALTAADGNVYIFGIQHNTSNLDSPYLTTWNKNELIKLDMGFSDKEEPVLNDLYLNDNKLISLGTYLKKEEKVDDNTSRYYYNSYITFYDTQTKQKEIWEAPMKGIPDFLEVKEGYMSYSLDTVPIWVFINKSGQPILYTSESIIVINDNSPETYPIPNFDMYAYPSGAYFDYTSNEIYLKMRNTTKQFYFNLNTLSWDSSEASGNGIKYGVTMMKILRDKNLWAADIKGFVYKYKGAGHFEIVDMKCMDRQNLNIPVNDAVLLEDKGIALATDAGLFINETLFTGVPPENVTSGTEIVQPNPAFNFISIRIGSDIVRDFDYSILDLFGRVLKSGLNCPETINIESLSAGIYFLKCHKEGMEDVFVKFIKN